MRRIIMNNYENNLRKKAFSSAIWKFMERIIAQGVSLVVSIIIARILDPTDYSVVGIVTIFFTFANVLISGGFNTALIQKKDADEEDYSSVLFLSIFISIVLYVILFFTGPLIAKAYKQPILIDVIRVMGLILPVNAVKSIVCAFISSSLQFKKFFFATIGGTIFSAIVGIWMALKGFGPWALVAQQMSNTIIDTIILIIITRIHFVFRVSLVKLKQLFKYGSKIFATSSLIALYNEINPLFIGLKYTAADLSFYSKGKSFPALLTSTTNNTLSAVLFPVMSKVQDDKEALLRYTRRFIRVSSFVLFPVMLGFLACSDNFIRVVLTEKWLPASIYVKIFCVANMFDVIHTGNCETIKGMGRSDIYLKMEIIKKTLYFVTIGLFMLLTNTPVALAFSAIVCTLIAIIVNSIPNIRLINYTVKKQAQDLLPNLVISIAMCALVSLVSFLNIHPALVLVIQIVLGVLIYIGLAYVTKNESFNYLKKLVVGKFIRKDS